MAKLDESDKIIAQEVLNAYNTCEDGRTRTWASKEILNTIAFNRNEREFAPRMHGIILSVICTMIKVGKLKGINVKGGK